MKLTPSDPFQSLVFVTWRRADYLVLAMARALGLGLTPCKPFLTRRVRVRLASDLARLEALVRRLLVLMVLERPLPPVSPVRAMAPRSAVRAGAIPGPRRHLAIPAFRLDEAAPRANGIQPPPPRRPSGPLRPRILSLDQPLPPPEPWEYPPRADDLVPSQPLVRRLAALWNVFDDPATHIARMARHIARSCAARPYRLAPLPPAARARHVPQDERDALGELDLEAALQLADLDSS